MLATHASPQFHLDTTEPWSVNDLASPLGDDGLAQADFALDDDFFLEEIYDEGSAIILTDLIADPLDDNHTKSLANTAPPPVLQDLPLRRALSPTFEFGANNFIMPASSAPNAPTLLGVDTSYHTQQDIFSPHSSGYQDGEWPAWLEACETGASTFCPRGLHACHF